MDKYIKILEELKTSEDNTLRDIMLFAIVCFIADLAHLYFKFHFPEFIRITYFLLFLLCFYVARNRYHRHNRLKREREEQERQKQEEYITQVNAACSIAFPIITNMTVEEIQILKLFADKQKPEIVLQNDLQFGKLTPVYIANSINGKLIPINPIGIIKIGTSTSHTILTIDSLGFDIVNRYFS